MKAPRCPKCGKEHYSTQRCSADVDKAPGPVPEKTVRVRRDKAGSSPAPESNEVHRESSSGDQDAPVIGEGAVAMHCSGGADSRSDSQPPTPHRQHVVEPPTPAEAQVNNAKVQVTNAEKQKAYRERHKDRVREADRLRKLRMRKKRDG